MRTKFTNFLILLFLVSNLGLKSQNLTISLSGQTGTSGTNWSISNGILYYTANANVQASVITNALASGDLTIQAISNDVNVNVNQNITSTANGSGIIIGNANSTGTVTFNRTVDLYGPLTVHANKINMDSELLTPGESAQLITRVPGGHVSLLAKNGFETIATANCVRGKIMTVNGGNIHITADADNNNTGELNIDWLTIDGTSGSVLMEGAIFNWNTGSQCALPELYSNGGTFTIRNTTSSNYSISTNWVGLIGTYGALTIGKDGGTESVTIEPCTVCANTAINFGTNAFQIAGPFTAMGGNIDVKINLSSTLSGADILFKATKNIIVQDSKTIQTNNGDITFWSNSDGIADATNGDFIGLYSGVSINSANGLTNQISGGGTITMAGGTTTQTLASGSVVPTDYALSTRTTNWFSLPPGGINFGKNTSANGELNSLSIYSGGGNIVIKGKSNSSSAGVQWFSGSAGAVQVINSGIGSISFDGLSTSNTAHGIEFNSYASIVFPTITSSNTTSAAINIKGETSSTNLRAGYQGTVILIADAAGGGIEVNGKVGSTSNYGTIEASSLNAYALSGPITFICEGGLGLRAGGTWGKGTLPSSSSNIILRSDKYSLYATTLQTTGSLVVEPFGSSFASALTFPMTNLTVPNTLSGLTVGKSTNTANLTFGSATSIAGPITAYGGTIAVNQNLTSTLSGSPILVQATGAINLASSRTIQSNGGSITFRSNSAGAALSAASSIILNSGSTLNSQGGNITLGGNFTGAQGTGLYATSGNAPAILIDGGSISAAGGNIKLYGKCNSSYDDGIRLRGTINTTGAGTIELYGEAHGGNNGTNYFGGITFGESAGSTIETENGNLTLSGLLTNTQSNSTGAINFYRTNGAAGQTRHINLLSKTGNINVTADRGSTSAYGIGHSSWGNVYVGSPASGWTATGNAIFNYSSLVNAGFNGIIVKTIGAVTYQPIAASFAVAQTFPANSNYILAESASSLTIGKSSNTASITLGSALSVAGPISVYGGDISVNDDIASTTGGDISLIASNGFTTTGSSSIQRDITTSGGNIRIEADSDANGTGTLNLDFMLMNAGSGNTTISGELMSFNTSNDTERPWISGTGVATIESNDASFGQDISLLWFKLANGLGGLNFGKTTNTTNMNFNSAAALSFVGPVNVTGAAVAFSTALTIANDNLSVKASGAVTQTAAITASGLALNGTGTFTLTNTSNNFQTIAGGAVGTLLGATQIVDASGGLTIGTVGSNSGIMGSGTIRIETLADNLTLASSISTTSTSTDAVILTSAKTTAIGVGTGGDIIVSGSPTVTVGTGGIAKFFSGYDVTSTGLTNLAGGSSNVRVNYDETSITFNPALSANNKYAIYRTALGYGDLTIVSSGGDAEGTTWIYDNGVIKTTNGAANVLNTDVQTKLNSADLSIEANKITFSANVTGSTSNTLSVLSKTHIVNSNATTITTAGGDVVLASNVDDTNDGESTTNGRIDFTYGLTITTNGGDITLGGGNALGTEYALGQSGGSLTEGIRIDVTTSLNSGGGNIAIKGKSFSMAVGASTGGSGVGFYFLTSAGSINSGTGTILIDGYSQTSAGDAIAGIFFWNNTANTFTIQSTNTTANAIILNGFSSGTSGQAFGIETEGSNTLNIFATGIGGGITLNAGNSIANYYDIVFRGATNILANSGPIVLKGGQLGGVPNGYLYLGGDLFIGSKTATPITSSSTNILISFDRFFYDNGAIPRIATSGAVNIESTATSFGAGTYTSWFSFNNNGQTMSSFRFGKTSNTAFVYLNTSFTTAGPISAYGGYVGVTGNITSSANGDILLKGTSGGYDVEVTSNISKTAGTGTLTMQTHGRVIHHDSGNILASGTGVLNVVMWSDFDNDNNDGGVSCIGDITTNGGHVWLGGSSSNGGSYTWNGLTVGDGPSIGSNGYNANAMDIWGDVTTNGGDFLAWAGAGFSGWNGIGVHGYFETISVGTGDIILITDVLGVTSGGGGSATYFSQNGGTFTLVPHDGSFAATFDWNPSIESVFGGTNNGWNFAGNWNYMAIANVNKLKSLTIGRYDGMTTSGGTPVVMTNNSNILISTAIPTEGPMSFYGGDITVNQNLTTTDLNAGILLDGSGIVQAAGVKVETNVGDITYAVTNAAWTISDNRAITIGAGTSTAAKILSNGGDISINASFATTGTSGGSDRAILINNAEIVSTNTGSIIMVGDATNNLTTNVNAWGIAFENSGLIQTSSGDLTLDGTGGKSSSNTRGIVIDSRPVSILSSSGTIKLTDRVPLGLTGTYNGLYIKAPVSSDVIIGTLTSSTSNVIMQADKVTFDATNQYAVKINTSGTFTLEPVGNAFANAITYPISNLSLNAAVSGLTIGKPSNTANITFNGSTNIAGYISAYGGTLSINENLTSSTGNTISLYGNSLNFGANKTVTSANGQLIIAPQDSSNSIGMASASGTLQLPASYFSNHFADGFSNIQIGSNNQTGAISANAFSLRDNMTLLTNNTLTLGGLVTLETNDLTLGSDISSIIGTPTYYFKTNNSGKVKRLIGNSAALGFPIGNSMYNSVEISNNTGSADLFSVNVVDAVYQNGSSGATVSGPHVQVTWDISKSNSNAGSGVDFTFVWDTIQESSTINPHILSHYNGSVWETATGNTGTAITNGSSKTITHSGYDGTFSPFSIIQAEPLPISLIGIQTECVQGQGVMINWQTASELNASHYELYRSDDAVEWNYIGNVIAIGTSNETSAYSFMDTEVGNDINYYQIKQVDIDGTYKMLPIINRQCNNFSEFSIYPNPTQSTSVIRLSLESDVQAEINVFDIRGKVVVARNQMLRKGNNMISIDLSNQENGMYIITIKNKNKAEEMLNIEPFKLIKY